MEIFVDEDQERLIANLRHSLGEIVCNALEDPTVVEIMLNPDGKVWIERFGAPMKHETDLTKNEGEFIISLVASSLDITANRSQTSIGGEFPIGGHRFQGKLPPNTPHPIFSIRRKAEKIFTLHDYVESGIITEEAKEIIESHIVKRSNIVIVGGTGTGKTTLANAVIHSLSQLSPNDRLIILEDTYELQSQSVNTLRLRATKDFPMTSQIEDTLRLRPDRILVGEVRDGAALDLLEAWNTGHPGGIATLHADSATEAFTRLETLVRRVSVSPLQEVIASAVDLIVYITRSNTKSARTVSEIISVTSFDHTQHKYIKDHLYHVEV